MYGLKEELNQVVKLEDEFKERLEKLKKIFGIKSETQNFAAINSLIRHIQKIEDLDFEYEIQCAYLRDKYKNEIIQTNAEKRFRLILISTFRLQSHTQTWIGNFCVDMFLPSLGFKANQGSSKFKFKSVAIEINGSIHDNPVKAKKDYYKMECLSYLGISVISITNEQVISGQARQIANGIKNQSKRLCSRARKRLWTKIYILTLLYHADLATLSKFFPQLKSFPNLGNKK